MAHLLFFVAFTTTEGAQPLRSLQGWEPRTYRPRNQDVVDVREQGRETISSHPQHRTRPCKNRKSGGAVASVTSAIKTGAAPNSTPV